MSTIESSDLLKAGAARTAKAGATSARGINRKKYSSKPNFLINGKFTPGKDLSVALFK